MHALLRATAFATALFFMALMPALADQRYDVSGDDAYRIGTDLPTTHIAYNGVQFLSIEHRDTNERFTAQAKYTRVDENGKASVHARFIQEMHRDGSFEDRLDEDPDFLTILNQPFAVQLDATTMLDLRGLRGSVPFEATSPLGGARLHGYLRPATSGKIHGSPAIGVRFEAGGPMTGTLPQHPEAALHGTIRMDGTAYYALHGALLLALDATLTIDGQLSSTSKTVPVRIVYHRTIRADNGAATLDDAKG